MRVYADFMARLGNGCNQRLNSLRGSECTGNASPIQTMRTLPNMQSLTWALRKMDPEDEGRSSSGGPVV